jgi:hypothetical protein
MNDYLPSINMNNAPSAGSITSLQQDLLGLFKSVYNEILSPTSQTQTYIIRLTVQICSKIDDLSTTSLSPPKNNEELGKYALTISTMSELGRIDATKHFTQLLEECLSTFSIISEDSRSVDTMTPSLSFSWILHAIHVHIYKSNGKVKKMKLDWLMRILDVLIVITSIPQKNKLVRGELLEYGINVVLNGLVSLSFEEYSNELNQFNGLSTSKSYELWDEKFENVMQNAVNVKRLSLLILREFTNSSEAKDNGIESAQKQVCFDCSLDLFFNRIFMFIYLCVYFIGYKKVIKTF